MVCPKSQQSWDRGLMSVHSAFILLTQVISELVLHIIPPAPGTILCTWWENTWIIFFIYIAPYVILWFRETYNFLSSALNCLSKTAKNQWVYTQYLKTRRLNHFPCCGCHHEIFTWFSPILTTRNSAREKKGSQCFISLLYAHKDMKHKWRH